jgi:hypothetical protein
MKIYTRLNIMIFSFKFFFSKNLVSNEPDDLLCSSSSSLTLKMFVMKEEYDSYKWFSTWRVDWSEWREIWVEWEFQRALQWARVWGRVRSTRVGGACEAQVGWHARSACVVGAKRMRWWRVKSTRVGWHSRSACVSGACEARALVGTREQTN